MLLDYRRMFQIKCTSCDFAIEPGDKYLEALSGTYHADCFTCSVCFKYFFLAGDENENFTILFSFLCIILAMPGELRWSTICSEKQPTILPQTWTDKTCPL